MWHYKHLVYQKIRAVFDDYWKEQQQEQNATSNKSFSNRAKNPDIEMESALSDNTDCSKKRKNEICKDDQNFQKKIKHNK